MASPLIESLLRAVAAAPDDLQLRLHVAELMIGEGDSDAAISQVSEVLLRDPANMRARELMAAAITGGTPKPSAQPGPAPQPPRPASPAPTPPGQQPSPVLDPRSNRPGRPQPATSNDEFWSFAESQLDMGIQPMFVSGDDSGEDDYHLSATNAPSRPEDVWDVVKPTITLADVGGLESVKTRLEMSFLGPLRNPEMARMYGKSLRGGLLLYGPPGCGKTFVAKALAGEMGTKFISITLADVLGQWLGQTENQMRALFERARAIAPVVVFFDEVDAIGARRSSLGAGHLSNLVNQLLQEMDGTSGDNDGVYILGATNAPWDLDAALRRPGRFDRTALVPPPDAPAREAILRGMLSQRPVEGIDLGKLVNQTDGFSGADLKHLVDSATEKAMFDSTRSGQVRMIGMRDLLDARKEVRTSMGSWFDAARNVLTYSDRSGEFDELRDYMRRRKLL